MKVLRILPLILVFLCLGAGTAYLFDKSMGVTVNPRETMPENPPVLNSPPTGLETNSLSWIMFDPGAVGVEADTAAWLAGDYDHELRRFTAVYRPAPVYVDSIVMDEYKAELLSYLQKIRGMGATALEFPMFLELIDFDKLGTGFEVYSEDSPMRERHKAYRAAFGRLFSVVDSMGMDLVLSSDMVVLTPELESYLRKLDPGLNTANPAFWQAYKKGLEELFERFPMIDAFQIRVGEAGSFYNRPNWPYRSELWVDDLDEVRTMLSSLLEPCRESGRKLIFRSWTIGMGSIGELHTDTTVYRQVFEGLEDENLWVSTKWVQGDFYPYTPYNPTLSEGEQGRIIEFQARREYEAFSSYPLWIVPYEQYALQKALETNPHIKGCWIWTLNGGPIRRSPMSLYPHTGDLTWIDLNARGTAAIAQDPWLDTDSLLAVYLKEYFHADDSAVTVMTGLLNESHAISRAGLAFPTAVKYRIRGLGTDVPAGIYTYWDLVLASTAVNSILYYAGADEYEELLESNRITVRELDRIMQEVVALEGHMDSTALEGVLGGLRYERYLFRTLAIHKQWILHFYRYLHKGDRDALLASVDDAGSLRTLVDKQDAAYTGRLDHRPFSFEDALRETSLSTKAVSGVYIRWGLVLLALISSLYLFSARSRVLPVWLAPLAWLVLLAAGKFDALSPYWALVSGLAAILYALLALWLYRNMNRSYLIWNRSWAVLILLWLAGALINAWRGPMAFGFWFWTSATFRMALFALGSVLLGMHIHLLRKCLGGIDRWLLPFALWLLALAIGMGAFWSDFNERMTVVNHEAALLPNSIVHTWGFTQMFGLPEQVIDWPALAAIAVFLAALVVTSLRKRVQHR